MLEGVRAEQAGTIERLSREAERQQAALAASGRENAALLRAGAGADLAPRAACAAQDAEAARARALELERRLQVCPECPLSTLNTRV